MFTKYTTTHAYETPCMSLIRLLTIKTSVVDSFRPSNKETYTTCVSTVSNFEGVHASVSTLGVGKQRKPSFERRAHCEKLGTLIQRVAPFDSQ